MSKQKSVVKKVVLLASVGFLALNAAACVGKGKGKAPPPVAAPLITKG